MNGGEGVPPFVKIINFSNQKKQKTNQICSKCSETSENCDFFAIEPPMDQRPVFTRKFVCCGPVENKHECNKLGQNNANRQP